VVGGIGRSGALAGLAALALFAGAGCGGSGDRPLPASVTTSASGAARELQRAFADGDIEKVCALMSASAREAAGRIAHASPTRCVPDVRKVVSMLEKGGGLRGSAPRIARVAGTGGRRTVTFAANRGWRADVPFVKQGGRWRLDAFFGAGTKRLDHAERTAPRLAFPAAGGPPIEASDRTGTPCAEVSTARFPRVFGGCSLRVKQRRVPIRILTPFGAFKFADCNVNYSIHVDQTGRSWTDRWDFVGPDESGCSDLNQCVLPKTSLHQPSKGRFAVERGNRYVHRAHLCLRTCVGPFVGELVVTVARTPNGWRARQKSEGATGFKIDGELAVLSQGFDLRPAG